MFKKELRMRLEQVENFCNLLRAENKRLVKADNHRKLSLHLRLLEAGNAAQLEKLAQYSEQTGMMNMPYDLAAEKLCEEVVELEKALIGANYNEIRLEAADIANYAHTIIRRCDNLLVAGRREEVRSAEENVLSI